MAENQEKQKEIKYLIRVNNTDLVGKKTILMALQKIQGIGRPFANAILSVTGLDKHKKAGYMSDDEVKKIEGVIQNPSQYSLPDWMLNRRADYETGENKHNTMSDLKFQQQIDTKRLQKIKSYRGMRLQAGLTVRGQRTKSNFRKNKGKGFGVKKKTTIRK